MPEGFKDRYDDHMVGRNGGDAISRVCLVVAIVLVVLSFFCVGISPFLYVLVLLLGIAAAVYAALRMNSRNVAARQAENEAFVGFFQRFGRKDEQDARAEAREERRARRARENRAERRERVERDYADEEPAYREPEPQPEPEPEPAAQPEKVTVTCDSCGQHLRVPAGKGNIKVRCPKCQNVFQLFT